MFLGFSTSDPELAEIIRRKAKPYFQRGYSAVMERRTIRTFDEAADIIMGRFREDGLSGEWPELIARTFARAYIYGVAVAARLTGLWEPHAGNGDMERSDEPAEKAFSQTFGHEPVCGAELVIERKENVNVCCEN